MEEWEERGDVLRVEQRMRALSFALTLMTEIHQTKWFRSATILSYAP